MREVIYEVRDALGNTTRRPPNQLPPRNPGRPGSNFISDDTNIHMENNTIVIRQGNKKWRFDIGQIDDAQVTIGDDRVLVKQKDKTWTLRFNAQNGINVYMDTVFVKTVNEQDGDVTLNGENLFVTGKNGMTIAEKFDRLENDIADGQAGSDKSIEKIKEIALEAKEKISNAFENTQSKIDAVQSNLDKKVEQAKSIAQEAKNKISNAFDDTQSRIDEAKDGLNKKIDTVQNNLDRKVEQAKSIATEAKDKISNAFEDTQLKIDEVQNNLDRKVEQAKSVAQDVEERVTNALNTKADKADIDDKIEQAKEVAQKAAEKITNAFKRLDEKFTTKIETINSSSSVKGSVSTFADLPPINKFPVGTTFIVEKDENKGGTSSLYTLFEDNGIKSWEFTGEFSVNLDNYYTKSEINSTITGLETEVNTKVDADFVKEETRKVNETQAKIRESVVKVIENHLEAKADKSDIDNKIEKVKELAQKAKEKVEEIVSEINSNLNEKANKTDVDQKIEKAKEIAQKAKEKLEETLTELNASISAKIDKSEVDEKIEKVKELAKEVKEKLKEIIEEINTSISGKADNDDLEELSNKVTEIEEKFTEDLEEFSNSLDELKEQTETNIDELSDKIDEVSEKITEVEDKSDENYTELSNKITEIEDNFTGEIEEIKDTLEAHGNTLTELEEKIDTEVGALENSIESHEERITTLEEKTLELENYHVSRDLLRSLVEDARDYKYIPTSENDGKDLIPGTEYVTAAQKNSLSIIVQQARDLLKKEFVTKQEISALETSLSDALTIFASFIHIAPTHNGGTVQQSLIDANDLLLLVVEANDGNEVFKNLYWVPKKFSNGVGSPKQQLTAAVFLTTWVVGANNSNLGTKSWNEIEQAITAIEETLANFKSETKIGTKEFDQRGFIESDLGVINAIHLGDANVGNIAKLDEYILTELYDAISDAEEILARDYNDPNEELDDLTIAFEELRRCYMTFVEALQIPFVTWSSNANFSFPAGWLEPDPELHRNEPTELGAGGSFTQDQLTDWGDFAPNDNYRAATFYVDVDKTYPTEFNQRALIVNGVQGGFGGISPTWGHALGDGTTRFKIAISFATRGDNSLPWTLRENISGAELKLVFAKDNKALRTIPIGNFPTISLIN